MFRLRQLGVNNVAAVGGSGTAMSAERWALLADAGVRQVMLCLDCDDAGKKGTIIALDNHDKAIRFPDVMVIDPEKLAS